MSYRAGDVIKRSGKYRICHYRQHVKDGLKNFKPESVMSLPVCFPSCDKCPAGFPVYTLKEIENMKPNVCTIPATRSPLEEGVHRREDGSVHGHKHSQNDGNVVVSKWRGHSPML